MMYARSCSPGVLMARRSGHSSLKDIVPGDSGSIHLHMWRADLRGKGHGSHLFCLAVVDFYKRFKLRRMICEPKADNLAANRLLRRIGFPFIFTRVGKSSELSAVCKLNRYDIVREIAEDYLTWTWIARRPPSQKAWIPKRGT